MTLVRVWLKKVNCKSQYTLSSNVNVRKYGNDFLNDPDLVTRVANLPSDFIPYQRHDTIEDRYLS